MKSKILLLILILSLSISSKKVSAQNLNISFLLDLSDRIDPKKYPEFYQRDVQYIKSVEKAFIAHIKQKKIIQLNDQIQVYFNPEPKNPEINKLSQQLKANFDKTSSKGSILSLDKTFSEIPIKIYQSAIKDGQFIGSDIWKFFKNNVRDYCIKDNHRNILIILTDGYMYHKDSKFLEGNKSSFITPDFIRSRKLISSDYKAIMVKNKLGFIPVTNNLKDLEIIVLGINASKKNPYEEDVINQYWADWFRAMNVKKFYIKSADLPANLDPVIQKIILEK
ncbi:hypothetical protein [Pedobacter punctiformis]|uniref:VWFA domain-containing protein n=1 Tax=Pedobacter punctiformis TaxID=3004097 RepID=A0ABT4LBF6_9SPHI|nr:hypothetical protein [Pedobacter sp. HCMS5-2]MCZ4245257.1 hypothetical protein [Pedobacter sp. HCMS5-2]